MKLAFIRTRKTIRCKETRRKDAYVWTNLESRTFASHGDRNLRSIERNLGVRGSEDENGVAELRSCATFEAARSKKLKVSSGHRRRENCLRLSPPLACFIKVPFFSSALRRKDNPPALFALLGVTIVEEKSKKRNYPGNCGAHAAREVRLETWDVEEQCENRKGRG
ncbi:hypothetical protein KM043_014148 [Ampulex compressa]|nr:hypothetical protein KM043_014148 [Ampulex compressa]